MLIDFYRSGRFYLVPSLLKRVFFSSVAVMVWTMRIPLLRLLSKRLPNSVLTGRFCFCNALTSFWSELVYFPSELVYFSSELVYFCNDPVSFCNELVYFCSELISLWTELTSFCRLLILDTCVSCSFLRLSIWSWYWFVSLFTCSILRIIFVSINYSYFWPIVTKDASILLIIFSNLVFTYNIYSSNRTLCWHSWLIRSTSAEFEPLSADYSYFLSALVVLRWVMICSTVPTLSSNSSMALTSPTCFFISSSTNLRSCSHLLLFF